tara:strand:- start:1438 stop:2754 length:1317 start_codon:yes stop_codon:yes gene_type:complete
VNLSSHDRQLWTLAIPAFGALMAEPLYVLADTAIVGHLGTAPLGGLAVSSSALLTIYGLCFFLAYGTTASVARMMGAGEKQKSMTQAIQSLWLAGILGILLAIFGYSFATPLLRAMGADGELLIQARIYLRVSMYGAPAMLIMMAGVGYLRGLKDTVRPLWIAVGTALLNLILEIILIYGFSMKIGSSAAATVIAQWVGALIYLNLIGQTIRPYHIPIIPNFRVIGQLLKVSWELFIRNLSITSTFLVATAAATRLGNIDVAAHQVAYQAWFMLAMTMDAMAIAAQTLVGNLLGADKAKEAIAVGRRTIIWSVGVGILSGGILAAIHVPLAQVFSDDQAVISLTEFLFIHVALMAPISGIAFALDGILIGAGDQNFLAKTMAGTAMVTIALMLVTRGLNLGIGWLWATIWIFMGLRSLLLGLRFFIGRWQVVGSKAHN